MPDLIHVFSRRWQLIIGLTLLSTAVALIAALASPKQYLSIATALPLNSVVADKGRLFNNNIQELYSNFGAPDELDRIEGTGALDTIYIATSKELNLADRYDIKPSGESLFKAAEKLKKYSRINRSAYGELKVKVWDEDRNMAAAIANTLLKHIQDIHQHLQNESNALALQKIEEAYNDKKKEYVLVADSLSTGSEREISLARKAVILEELQQYEKMKHQYQLAMSTNPQVLLTVEPGRAPVWPDKPRVLPTVLISFFASFIFVFLMALYLENKK